MTRLCREGNGTAPGEVAGDPLLGDQTLQQLHGLERELEHPAGALRAHHSGQLLHLRLIPLKNKAAVSAAGAPAKMMPLQERDIGSVPGKSPGRREAGVAAADNRDISRGGKRGSGEAGKRGGISFPETALNHSVRFLP